MLNRWKQIAGAGVSDTQLRVFAAAGVVGGMEPA